MKLLSTPQGKSVVERSIVTQEIRITELDTLITQKRKELNDIDAQGIASLSEIGLRNYEEEALWKGKIEAIQREVSNLELRRAKALEPFTAKEQALLAREQTLTAREQAADARSSELSSSQTSIEKRIKAVSEREQQADARKKEIEQAGVSQRITEEESVSRQIQAEQAYEELLHKEVASRETLDTLSTEVSALREERRELLTPIKERERGLNSREETLNSREVSVSIYEQKLSAQADAQVRMDYALSEREDQVRAREQYLEDLEYKLTEKQIADTKTHEKAMHLVQKERDELQQQRQDNNAVADALKIERLSQEKFHTDHVLPLEQRTKQVDTREEALSQREESILIKETDLNQTSDILTERLDEVSEREQNALSYAADLEARNGNLSIKEGNLKKREEAVSEVMKEALGQKLLGETDIARRQAVLKGRDTVLNERERQVAKAEKGFAAREKAIADRYQTLERAIAEMKLKYGDKLTLKP